MSYDIGDCEPVSFYAEYHRKARIEHTCTICHTKILKGERYCDVRSAFDGRAIRIKRCPGCQAVYEHLQKKCDGVDRTVDMELNCGSEYKSEWDEEPPPEIAALAFRLPGEPIAKEPEHG